MRVRAGVWCGLVTLGFAAQAAAQTDTGALAATRRDLIQQAQQARTAGDHPRSLDLAQRAGQLGMSPSLRRFVAEEQNALGQLGPALSSAERCVHEAERDAASPARDEHLAACRALVTSLQPRVGRVVVEVTAPPPGLHVSVAGVDLPEAVWGVAHVVTPGTVGLDAFAAGFRAFHRDVSVTPGATVHVGVQLDAVPRPVVAVATVPVSSVGTVVTPPADDPVVSHRLNLPPLAVASAGGGLVVLSLIFLGVRTSALNSYQAMCVSTGCPESARPDHDRAVTFNTLGNVTLGVGAAAAVGGGIWFLLAPRVPLGASRRVSLDVQPGTTQWTVGLRGSL